ncbi:pyridoxamine 5'-phosphate oxidase family protein [Actinoplanes sp. Pm04-4]|uniref:Pyridoxamine 5'-phosphate oxidase family protein n=1 Tax=Paractinoplanes pyxinae TaxID=2997416 RepID=A0ABT4B6E3_9ACTN|nr:pyridoxamine 5'-phosphate oxidase family protein [Actinoplanes pyxinae]MCY1142064.1 pyridoxamine 5'-phosphate oxidase family protein [Actinoplanes pyxinae]
MSQPRTTMIKRVGDQTKPGNWDEASVAPAGWDDVRRRLREGPGPCWLSAGSGSGPHVRPVFAAWTGDSFVVASNPGARKTAVLRTSPVCSVAIDLKEMHLVVEGRANRLTAEPDLRRSVAAFDEVFSWPTEVDGDLLTSSYAAPSSGGPSFEVYEIRPVKAYAFPTSDQFEPTRFNWK